MLERRWQKAEQSRSNAKGGMKGLGRRGGGWGPRGSGGGRWLASCSEVPECMGVPGLLQQLLPWPEPCCWLLSPEDGEEKEAPAESYCPWTSIREVRA